MVVAKSNRRKRQDRVKAGAKRNEQARRPLSLLNPTEGAYYASVLQTDDGATASYNALLIRLEHRLSSHVSMLTNYTWSHCIGSFSGYNSKTDQTVTVPGNPLFDRGNCDSDRRNVFNLTAVAMTPKEFDLLLMMVSKRGGVITREEIGQVIWGKSAEESARTLDTHIWRLRSKLGELQVPHIMCS